MTNDFSAHYAGGAKDNSPRDESFIPELDKYLTTLEKLQFPEASTPELEAFVNNLTVGLGNLRSLLEMERNRTTRPGWKPWVIGGHVEIIGGPYMGTTGRLLRMVPTLHGQMAEVEVDEIGVVEVGPAWLQGK